MWTNPSATPEQLPILSRGKHRSPRKGACFMEMASYLAGERWSDHPPCTHPLLASLARGVNDLTSDEGRHRLAVHIPSVIGLTSDDLRVDVRLSLLCARMALPVVGAERQRVLAVAILVCERVLDDLDERPSPELEPLSRAVLEQVPQAAEWAHAYVEDQRVSRAGFRRHAAPTIVANAVKGIAAACVADPDALLHDLLVEAIGECRRWVSADPLPAVELELWDRACRLTGSSIPR